MSNHPSQKSLVNFLIAAFAVISLGFNLLLFVQTPPTVKRIALTIDDCPDNSFLPRILDLLKRENVKATFFLIGEHMEKYPQLTRRIFDAGHVLGNHTYHHYPLYRMDDDQLLVDEFFKTDQVFEKIFGWHPRLVRPPYTSLKVAQEKILLDKGYQIIYWSIDTYDWKKGDNTTAKVLARIDQFKHPDGIILFHCPPDGGSDNEYPTLRSLDESIKLLKKNGYRFVTIPELMKNN